MRSAAVWGVLVFATVAACSNEPGPLVLPTGSGASGPASSGPGPGSGGDGGMPAPVFDLPCGADSCAQGTFCCDAAGNEPACVADAGACLGIAYPCNSTDDCAGAGEPEVCCAFYDLTGIEPVLQEVVCENKGACSGMGAVRMCADTMECDECAQGVAMPDGFQTCGSPQ
jgi:hypothetical protein